MELLAQSSSGSAPDAVSRGGSGSHTSSPGFERPGGRGRVEKKPGGPLKFEPPGRVWVRVEALLDFEEDDGERVERHRLDQYKT